MFTGLVEEVGIVRGAAATERGLRIEIGCARVLAHLRTGDSIAVDGVCQTVVTRSPTSFTVEAMAPTLSRTTIGRLRPGGRVNLERALALGERLGGHLVQGHIDAVGTVERIERVGEHVLVSVALPGEVAELTVPHGAIAINGVSLTINEKLDDDTVQVALIPHTWDSTNFPDVHVGDGVNVEGDMIGKFVVEYLKRRGVNAI